MITRVLYAGGVICAILCLLAFLSVISHGLAIPLLVAAIVCLVLAYVLGNRANTTL